MATGMPPASPASPPAGAGPNSGAGERRDSVKEEATRKAGREEEFHAAGGGAVDRRPQAGAEGAAPLPFGRLPSVVSWYLSGRGGAADRASASAQSASHAAERADLAEGGERQDLSAKLRAFKQRRQKIELAQSLRAGAGAGAGDELAEAGAAEPATQTAGEQSTDLGEKGGEEAAAGGGDGAAAAWQDAEHGNQLKPLRLKVNHAEPRRERGRFKRMLEEPVQLRGRKRDPSLCAGIVRGVITPDVRAQVLTVQKRIVSFLLSSTFTDTEWERNLLLDDVMPYLQDYARMHMFEIKLVEMRWGIRKDASEAHKTSEICMAELERCQRESQGYFYVFIGAQKYGFRPFPAKIPKPIYDLLYEASKYAPPRLLVQINGKYQSHKWLLDQHFRLDTNNVPGPHEDDAGVLGLVWENVGSERPDAGTEIMSEALAEALQQRTEFSEEELDELQVPDLSSDCFIKSGESYFRTSPVVRDAVGGEGGREGDEAEERDEWQGPAGAVYVLRSAAEFGNLWWDRFERIQQVLRHSAKIVWKDLNEEGEEQRDQDVTREIRQIESRELLPDNSTSQETGGTKGVLRDPNSKAFIKKFFISVTEEEFSRGMLWRSEQEQRDKTMVLRRIFQDLDQRVEANLDNGIQKFIDVSAGKVDEEAQEFLSQQLAMVPDHVNVVEYPALEWVPKIGLDPENMPAHRDYLRKFMDDFCVAMMKSIVVAAKRLAEEPDPLVDEATQHLRFALNRGFAFKGTESTHSVQAVIAAYLVDSRTTCKDVANVPLEETGHSSPMTSVFAGLRKNSLNLVSDLAESAQEKLAAAKSVAMSTASAAADSASAAVDTIQRGTLAADKRFSSSTASAVVDDAAAEREFDVSKTMAVYGRSGAGKTYLLSKIMSDLLQRSSDMDDGRVVVVRFLGTTAYSSNVLNLLTSICEQLKRAYGKRHTLVPSDFIELKNLFITAVTTWPSENAPLTLFIDSVDQLDDSNAGRRLDWLPMTDLPSFLRIVVSTLPDYQGQFQCHSILNRNVGSGNMMHVPAISEHKEVLLHLLRRQGRRLTRTQTEAIAKIFVENSSIATPLWLTIVAQTVSSWTSYDELRFAFFFAFYLSTSFEVHGLLSPGRVKNI